MRSIDLTPAEWSSLDSLLGEQSQAERIPLEHQKKLVRLGVAAEKAGRMVATFEGRLMLRERSQRTH